MILVLENEVDLEERYLVDEMRRHLPEAEVYDYTREGGQPDLGGVDGVVVGGSTAGVYEEQQHGWISEQKELVRELVERRVPTLGICFGHQIVNDALGGRVEHTGERRANLVRAELGDDPLFDGVNDVVPVLHSDRVTETGDGMEVLGSTEYYDAFATRHRDAPVWTAQYHPEFTPNVKHLGNGWEDNHLSFDDSTATRTLKNFYELAKRRQSGGAGVRGITSRTD